MRFHISKWIRHRIIIWVFPCAPHVWRVRHVAHHVPCKILQDEGQSYNSWQYSL